MKIDKLGTDFMSDKELKRYIKNMEKYVEEQRKNMTKEAARDSLIRTGVLTKDGKRISEHQRIGDK